MYTLPATAFLGPAKRTSKNISRNENTPASDHKERIQQELIDVGVTKAGLLLRESRHLHTVIHTDEHLGGVVYGFHEDGMAMLVATDRRVIFLDKKPFFEDQDEITYDVVSGVTIGKMKRVATVKLHTRIKDYSIRTYNPKCAQRFVDYIEWRGLEHANRREY